ncbi:hypothetical protein HMPREF2875_10465 [Corynebacterium sp. HMSC078H07]|nr:hypothetical protein HMPREF2875_10465 [Corynebacterium sp. HMSC078H07]
MAAFVDMSVIGGDNDEPVFAVFSSALFDCRSETTYMLINGFDGATVLISHESVHVSSVVNTAAVHKPNIKRPTMHCR